MAREAAPTLLNVGNGVLGLFYACVLTLAVERVGHAWWTDRLAAVGRLALTNYLLQTVVVTTALYGYGLGWYGRVDFLSGLGLSVVIFAAQVVASHWWVTRWGSGPVERLWRRLAYGTS